MCPKRKITTGRHKQRGGALAIAVFVIIVMSLLTAAISRSISASTAQTVQEVWGTRALLAAEAGNEFALAQIFPLAPASGTCVAQTQLYFSNNGLNNCQVDTFCTEQVVGSETFYLVESVGVCKDTVQGNNAAPNSLDFQCSYQDQECVSRRIEIEAKTL